MDAKRAAFEEWMKPKFSDRMKWTGTRYEHPRTQMQWNAFQMGWLMSKANK